MPATTDEFGKIDGGEVIEGYQQSEEAGLTDSITDQGPEKDTAVRSRLVFPVAEYGLMFDTELPMEFLENQKVYSVLSAHQYFLGLINRRGSLVPIYDIRPLLQHQASGPSGEILVLVLGEGDDAVGIVLDAIPFRITLTEENQIDTSVLLLQVFSEYLITTFQSDGQIYLELKLDSFLDHLSEDVKFSLIPK